MDKTIHQLVKLIGEICQKNKFSLVTAESCTGGALAFFISIDEKHSDILERGYIVYSESSKKNLLDISDYTLQIYGAVSKEVAIKMSQNALEKSRAQISIAVTGIDEKSASKFSTHKPGIIWISCAAVHKKTITKKIHIRGNRNQFNRKAVIECLKLLHNFVKS